MYLYQKTAYNKGDWVAVYQNLQKSRRQWGMIVRMMERTGETVRDRVAIYKAVVQSMFLYISEVWVVTGEMFKVREGFYHWTARGITGMTKKRGLCREWYYPSVVEGAPTHTGVHQETSGDHSEKGWTDTPSMRSAQRRSG